MVEYRVTGRIDGLRVNSDFDTLVVISASLPRRRERAVSHPSLGFGERGWYIYFADLEPLEQSSDNPVIFDGSFELL